MPLLSGWAWEDAYAHDVRTLAGANRALRLELRASRHYPADVWLPGAFQLAQELETVGFWWQARTLRAHAARIATTRPRYAGRCAE